MINLKINDLKINGDWFLCESLNFQRMLNVQTIELK